MALVPAESKIPALMIAHIEARRTDADNPTPAANVLTLTPGPVKETTKRAFPSLEVWVSGFNMKDRRDDEQFDVMLDLHAHPDTVLATEIGWLASIRRSFAGGPISKDANAATANTNPFMAYCNGLSEANRLGWAIDNFVITGGSIIVDRRGRVLYRTTAECRFRSYVFTV